MLIYLLGALPQPTEFHSAAMHGTYHVKVVVANVAWMHKLQSRLFLIVDLLDSAEQICYREN
jgi:hypothetical protein